MQLEGLKGLAMAPMRCFYKSKDSPLNKTFQGSLLLYSIHLQRTHLPRSDRSLLSLFNQHISSIGLIQCG